MPEVRLDVTDAPNSPRCCNSSAGGSPATPPGWPHRWKNSSATPPMASPSYGTTWSGSFSSSAAATASNSSAHDRVSGPPRLRRGLADLAGAVRGLGRCLAFEKVLDVPQAANELPSQVGLDGPF